jgi:hypothetical protein
MNNAGNMKEHIKIITEKKTGNTMKNINMMKNILKEKEEQLKNIMQNTKKKS